MKRKLILQSRSQHAGGLLPLDKDQFVRSPANGNTINKTLALIGKPAAIPVTHGGGSGRAQCYLLFVRTENTLTSIVLNAEYVTPV